MYIILILLHKCCTTQLTERYYCCAIENNKIIKPLFAGEGRVKSAFHGGTGGGSGSGRVQDSYFGLRSGSGFILWAQDYSGLKNSLNKSGLSRELFSK
jgi:hypothetical protein